MAMTMSITDELRREARGFSRYVYTAPQAEHLTAIADRIDAEHERCMADAELCASPTESQMVELGWIRLPKDADGEYIHIGDVMTNTHKDGFRAKRVTDIAYHEYLYPTVEVDEDRLRWHSADKLRHYHVPTVEDMLRDFAEKIIDSQIPDMRPTYDEAIAEYAEKLKLKEGE